MPVFEVDYHISHHFLNILSPNNYNAQIKLADATKGRAWGAEVPFKNINAFIKIVFSVVIIVNHNYYLNNCDWQGAEISDYKELGIIACKAIHYPNDIYMEFFRRK